MRLWLSGSAHTPAVRKCPRGPLVNYLSAAAAAMGARMLPRAVAARSSISVFNRLMTHSMASRP